MKEKGQFINYSEDGLKKKTAKRFLQRNRWKITRALIDGQTRSSIIRQAKKCNKILKGEK